MMMESELFKFIPNALPMQYRIAVWEHILTLDYKFNWADYNGIEEKYSAIQQLAHMSVERRNDTSNPSAVGRAPETRDRHGRTGWDYMMAHGIPQNFCDEVQELINNRQPNFFAVNLSFAGQQFWAHSHMNEDSFVYYANPEWRNEWAGETIIYEPDGETFHAAIPYTPGAVLWLNEGVPHALRAPSHQAPVFRQTIGIFYDKNITD